MAGKKQSKKGGKKAGVLVAVLVALITLPALATRSQAGYITMGLDTIPTRANAGFTLISGLSDPGEAAGIDLNNALPIISEQARLPGLVVRYKEERIVELGVLSGGYAGAAGDDSAPGSANENHAYLGFGGYLLESIKADAVWIIDSRAKSNYGMFVGVDLARLGPKLVSTTSAIWGHTGL